MHRHLDRAVAFCRGGYFRRGGGGRGKENKKNRQVERYFSIVLADKWIIAVMSARVCDIVDIYCRYCIYRGSTVSCTNMGCGVGNDIHDIPYFPLEVLIALPPWAPPPRIVPTQATLWDGPFDSFQYSSLLEIAHCRLKRISSSWILVFSPTTFFFPGEPSISSDLSFASTETNLDHQKEESPISATSQAPFLTARRTPHQLATH